MATKKKIIKKAKKVAVKKAVKKAPTKKAPAKKAKMPTIKSKGKTYNQM